jgi:hypothetical protein
MFLSVGVMRVLAPRAQNVEQPEEVGLIVDYKTKHLGKGSGHAPVNRGHTHEAEALESAAAKKGAQAKASKEPTKSVSAAFFVFFSGNTTTKGGATSHISSARRRR